MTSPKIIETFDHLNKMLISFKYPALFESNEGFVAAMTHFFHFNKSDPNINGYLIAINALSRRIG